MQTKEIGKCTFRLEVEGVDEAIAEIERLQEAEYAYTGKILKQILESRRPFSVNIRQVGDVSEIEIKVDSIICEVGSDHKITNTINISKQ